MKSYCLERGPAYAHPRIIEIVPELPLNGAGKIDRAAAQAKLKSVYQASAQAAGG